MSEEEKRRREERSEGERERREGVCVYCTCTLYIHVHAIYRRAASVIHSLFYAGCEEDSDIYVPQNQSQSCLSPLQHSVKREM